MFWLPKSTFFIASDHMENFRTSELIWKTVSFRCVGIPRHFFGILDAFCYIVAYLCKTGLMWYVVDHLGMTGLFKVSWISF